MVARSNAPAPMLVMTRVFEAPRRIVFEEWIKPANLVRWWGPRGFDAPAHETVVSPGDVFRFRRAGADGRPYWVTVTYREIVRPERLVFTWGGEPVETQTVVTVTFADEGATTRLTLNQFVLEPARAPDPCAPRWVERLDRLDAVVLTR